MTDQEFREIQLTGKQLFFLFMSAVVAAVVIFLLGVSVGRGVQGDTLSASTDVGAAGDTVVSASSPAPADQPPPQVSYDEKLQGQPPPAQTPAAQPETDPAAATPPPSAAAPPSTPPPAVTRNPSTAEVEPIRPAPGQGRAAAAPAGLVLQVGAFKSKENADSLVATLKAKGYSAFMAALPPPNPSFAVRVGPFTDRDAADKVAARLTREEGMKSFVISR